MYSINELYFGISTMDLELLRFYYASFFCGDSKLHVFLREHKNFFIRVVSCHDSYEEAKSKRVFGILNESFSRVPIIYKIFCLDPKVTEQYIGQTMNFDNRMFSHFISLNFHNSTIKLYDFIRSHGGWSNWKMITVRQYPVTTTKQNLDRLEYYWWKKLGGELNSIKPGTHRSKWKGSDEDFEENVFSGNLNLEKFSIKESTLDI